MGSNCCDTGKSSCCGESSCGANEECGCECHGCECCGEMSKDKMMFIMMMDLADEAYMKLAKQKMMAVWDKKLGGDMQKSAEFFVEQSMAKWMNEEEWMKNKDAVMEKFTKMMAEKKK
ncbi:hypothetical protein HY990_06395 [Candidatus Micrarchaeota archaeon]|nr:hypothetical protein [Candidatus Micrarchaeota archaeon]